MQAVYMARPADRGRPGCAGDAGGDLLMNYDLSGMTLAVAQWFHNGCPQLVNSDNCTLATCLSREHYMHRAALAVEAVMPAVIRMSSSPPARMRTSASPSASWLSWCAATSPNGWMPRRPRAGGTTRTGST